MYFIKMAEAARYHKKQLVKSSDSREAGFVWLDEVLLVSQLTPDLGG